MRAIIKKLANHQELNTEEYQNLMGYIQHLRVHSLPSYQVFYQRYAGVLYKQYSTYLPEFEYTLGDVISLLVEQPELLSFALQRPVQWQYFPPAYRPYLQTCAQNRLKGQLFYEVVKQMADKPENLASLPRPRDAEVAMLFEDQNPFKERGLKAHFDRLSRFTFITRLQSVRYLTQHKAKQDRVEVLAPDRLGGIFTNKEKSIYYYIYLTESIEVKARKACALINLALYGQVMGDSHDI